MRISDRVAAEPKAIRDVNRGLTTALVLVLWRDPEPYVWIAVRLKGPPVRGKLSHECRPKMSHGRHVTRHRLLDAMTLAGATSDCCAPTSGLY
jgi:hypothetical protein